MRPWLRQAAWANASLSGFAAMAASFWFLSHRVALVYNASVQAAG